MSKLSMCLMVLLTGLVVPSVSADHIDVDLAGWESHAFWWGQWASNPNSHVLLDIGEGSQVTGFEYSNLIFTSQGASLQAEFVLSVADPFGNEYLDWAPSTLQESGQFGPGSGSWNGDLGSEPDDGYGAGAPFVVSDGKLWVEVFDIYDDSGVDAIVETGTLRVYYNVPEPATAGLILAGGFACLRRRRR